MKKEKHSKIAGQVAAALLSIAAASVSADSEITSVEASPKPRQIAGTNQVIVGLLLKGASSTDKLTLGGGYTLTCMKNSTKIRRMNTETFSSAQPGVVGEIKVPASGAVVHTIDAFANWAPGSAHECFFIYSVRSSDAAVSASGKGSDFTFDAVGTQSASLGRGIVFEMVKPGGDSDDRSECCNDRARPRPVLPVLVDLGGDGIHLSRKGVGAYFDLNANGNVEFLQWITPDGDDAFLALDRNDNGVVDNGAELIGNNTPILSEGGLAVNGFVGLAQYDHPDLGGDDDGLITPADCIWPRLSLWLDSNADGASTPSEMLTLRGAGLASLETIPKRNRKGGGVFNRLQMWAWAELSENPGKTKMFDVLFRVLRPEAAILAPKLVASEPFDIRGVARISESPCRITSSPQTQF